MDSPINQVKTHIKEGRTSDSLSLLLELSEPNKHVHDSIHIILGEFNELTAQRLRGTIDNQQATRQLNSIHERILIALESFDAHGKILPTSASMNTGRSSQFLFKLGASIFIIGIVVTPIAYLLGMDEGHSWNLAMCISLVGLLPLGGWFLSVVANAIKGK